MAFNVLMEQGTRGLTGEISTEQARDWLLEWIEKDDSEEWEEAWAQLFKEASLLGAVEGIPYLPRAI